MKLLTVAQIAEQFNLSRAQVYRLKHDIGFFRLSEEAFQKALQNPLHSAHDSPFQASPKKPQNPALPEKSEVCEVVKSIQVERRRVEQDSKFPGLTGVPEEAGTKTGTVGDVSGEIPPDLAVVVSAWPALPEEVRRRVLDLIQEASRTATPCLGSRSPPVP